MLSYHLVNDLISVLDLGLEHAYMCFKISDQRGMVLAIISFYGLRLFYRLIFDLLLLHHCWRNKGGSIWLCSRLLSLFCQTWCAIWPYFASAVAIFKFYLAFGLLLGLKDYQVIVKLDFTVLRSRSIRAIVDLLRRLTSIIIIIVWMSQNVVTLLTHSLHLAKLLTFPSLCGAAHSIPIPHTIVVQHR